MQLLRRAGAVAHLPRLAQKSVVEHFEQFRVVLRFQELTDDVLPVAPGGHECIQPEGSDALVLSRRVQLHPLGRAAFHLVFLGFLLAAGAAPAYPVHPILLVAVLVLVILFLKADIVELDAEIYWQSAKSAISEAIGQAGIAPADIRSIAITGQAETLIMVDENGKPLRKAIVWLDNRAAAEAKELEERFGSDALFRLSGQTEMLPCWPAPKILWYRRHEPELFAKTAKFLMVEDFIDGREMTVGVLDGVPLPVIEICAKDGWYGYAEKYESD